MQVNAGVRFEPLAHGRCFMGAEVVQDDVQLLIFAEAPIQQFEKGQKLLTVGFVGDLANDFAVKRIECGVQGRGAVALVIMCTAADATRTQRLTGLRTIQCLNLGLLVNAEHHGVIGRVHVESDDIDHLVGKRRVVADLECLQPVRA